MADGEGVTAVNHLHALRPGLATACGSLPHDDAAEATDLLLDTLASPAGVADASGAAPRGGHGRPGRRRA